MNLPTHYTDREGGMWMKWPEVVVIHPLYLDALLKEKGFKCVYIGTLKVHAMAFGNPRDPKSRIWDSVNGFRDATS